MTPTKKYYWYFVVLVFVLIAIISFTELTANDKLPLTEHYIIYQQAPYDLFLFRITDKNSLTYKFVGSIKSCDSLNEIQAFIVIDSAKSIYTHNTPIHRDYIEKDSCIVEIYSSGVHSGELRHILEKPGEATILVFCKTGIITFTLTSLGEKELLNFIIKRGEKK